MIQRDNPSTTPLLVSSHPCLSAVFLACLDHSVFHFLILIAVSVASCPSPPVHPLPFVPTRIRPFRLLIHSHSDTSPHAVTHPFPHPGRGASQTLSRSHSRCRLASVQCDCLPIFWYRRFPIVPLFELLHLHQVSFVLLNLRASGVVPPSPLSCLTCVLFPLISRRTLSPRSSFLPKF